MASAKCAQRSGTALGCGALCRVTLCVRVAITRMCLSAPHRDVTLTYARGDTLEVADPYGNTFAVHASLPHYPVKHGIAYVQVGYEPLQSHSAKPASRHLRTFSHLTSAPLLTYGSQLQGLHALRSVCAEHLLPLLAPTLPQLPCFPGTARHIAAFYARRMGARVRLSGASAGAGGGAGGTAAGAGHARGDSSPARAEVVMGPGQQLVFVEQAHLGEASEEVGWAVCVCGAVCRWSGRGVRWSGFGRMGCAGLPVWQDALLVIAC